MFYRLIRLLTAKDAMAQIHPSGFETFVPDKITFLRTNTEFHREVTEFHGVKKISVDLCEPSVDLCVTKGYILDVLIFHSGWQTLRLINPFT